MLSEQFVVVEGACYVHAMLASPIAYFVMLYQHNLLLVQFEFCRKSVDG